MKTTSLLLVLTTVAAFSQAPLTPPGAPSPTQKSLQEIWDKIGAVEAQAAQLQAQNQLLKSQLTSASLLDAVTPAGLALPWNSRSVDSVGFSSSLAFGPDGQPCISYHEMYVYEGEDINSLKYARFSNNTWTVTTLDPDIGLFVGNTSLAFGPDGHPAVSYYRFFGNFIGIRRFNGSTWSAGVVSDQTNGYSDSSLAFGPDGQPAISYSNGDDDLKFARYDGSTWLVTTVDSAGSVGDYSSLSFGPDGRPAISYYDDTNDDLKFARYDGSVWTSTAVDSAGSVGSGCSLAFGPDGQPAISYLGDGGLKVARYDGNSWTVAIVDSAGTGSPTSSLAFGPDGQPAISYGANGGLRFARFTGGNWSTTTLYSGGSEPSLAYGPDGQPAISYSGIGGLKFARKGVFLPAP